MSSLARWPALVWFVCSLAVSGAAQTKSINRDLSRFYGSLSGAFVLLESGSDTIVRYNPAQCAARYSPASTFKIPNSLIGLETGVIPDQYFVLPWDHQKRNIAIWNRDHDLRSAIANSVVWYYQELARRVGAERMDSLVRRMQYGNMDISGGIDRFWLGSTLRISADEEVAFIRKLRDGTLPVSRRSQEIVKDILILEKSGDYVLRAKTGFASFPPDSAVGWFVGYVEKGEKVYFFASNIVTGNASRDSDAMFAGRKEIALKILRSFGLR